MEPTRIRGANCRGRHRRSNAGHSLDGKKPHLGVHVYEAAQQYFDIDVGLALHPNGIDALSIGKKVRDAYFNDVINIRDEQRECSTDVIITLVPKKKKSLRKET